MDKYKLILDGKDYGKDDAAYCRAYNNKVIEELRMKHLNEIPIRQPKRPKIKRHVVTDFKSHQRYLFWQDIILSCIVLAMLFTTVAIFTFNIDTSLN
tara:strand:+ start:831 stop:1121 length:291 start_codon:yes stop_codon:yes gene_type:complete